jgi:hypothetical protein
MIPEELLTDLKVLVDRGFAYELVEDGGRIFIVFKDYQLPPNLYNLEKTDLLIFTTPHYPNAGFDMFWVDEKLRLSNGGVPKNGDSLENYLGRNWRRFSYHPYNQKPWNPSDDNAVTFMGYVDQRLKRGD